MKIMALIVCLVTPAAAAIAPHQMRSDVKAADFMLRYEQTQPSKTMKTLDNNDVQACLNGGGLSHKEGKPKPHQEKKGYQWPMNEFKFQAPVERRQRQLQVL